MSAAAATWVVLLAILLAAGLLATMVASRRPVGGYRAWLHEVLRPAQPLDGPRVRTGGAVAEMRDAAEGETVGLADLLRDAESSDGYLTVPQRFEDRFEELTEGIAARQRSLAERRRADREERTHA